MTRNEMIFLDVETTGINEEDRLCQIAYSIPSKKIVVSEDFKPPVPISIDAMSICHITNEMVADKPPFEGSKTRAEIGKHFDDGLIFVAHNAQFDLKFCAK